MARPYAKVMELAFFVVEFGYTKADYEALTPTEREFVKKAWEEKKVRNTRLLNLAAYNANINAQRKKGRKFIDLFRKQKNKDITRLEADTYMEKLKVIEENSSKGWFEKILAANRRV